MADGIIPTEVEHFLNACIPAIAHLEALLLLRAEPGAAWTAESVAARLFITPERAASVLSDLAHVGLVAGVPRGEGPCRYAPRSVALREQVDRTAEIYRTRLIAVTQWIHARESSSIQTFADAFRLRKG